MGIVCLKATEPLKGDSLPFTTKLPEIAGNHLITLGRKAKSTLEPRSRFEHQTPGLGIQHLNRYAGCHATGINSLRISFLNGLRFSNLLCQVKSLT